MAILKVAQLGSPTLRETARPIDEAQMSSERVRRLVDDLVGTMREYAGVGLAAPQIRERERIFAMEVVANARYPGRPEFPLLVVANPVVRPVTDDMEEEWEGCLSIPGFRGLVARPRAIRLQGLDQDGEPLDLELEGFPAVVAQHETDHLNGVVFLDRMRDMSSLMSEEEYQRQIAPTLVTSLVAANRGGGGDG